MKLKAALFSTAIAVGLHIYLTLHYYGLNFGLLTSESACNINAAFNCDTVTASQYSSLFGIPMAMWGAATNAILAIMIMQLILGWTTDQRRYHKYTFFLSVFIAATSVVMGAISTLLLTSYCVFCIGAYITSFITLLAIWPSKEQNQTSISDALSDLFSKDKNVLMLWSAIPILAVFLHHSYISRVGAGELEVVVRGAVADWKASTYFDLNSVPASIERGSNEPIMTIEEFADFRCGHCKHAGPSLKAFVTARPNVKLKFYSFPLDGACNETMGQAGSDGISCFLAKSVYCAEKIGQKGWDMHDFVFSIQDRVNRSPILSEIKTEIMNHSDAINITQESLISCIESADTDKAIRAQAKAGTDAGLKGTPLFLVNGKKLARGQLLPVLEGVYNEIAPK